MEKFIFDGSMELEETTEYVFLCEDLGHAKDVFFNLYEENIEDFVEERTFEEEYTINGCVIILEINNETKAVENVCLSVQITADEELLELEPADIELDEKAIKLLLSKVSED